MRALALLVAAAACPRAAALVVYYNVFSKSVATAVEIVYEQLTELRASPIWDEVEEIRYSTIGKGKMRNHVARICREVNAMRPQGASKKPCVRLGSHKTGHEERTLTPLHAYCQAHPEASVAYLHDKGSFRNVFSRQVKARQKRLRHTGRCTACPRQGGGSYEAVGRQRRRVSSLNEAHFAISVLVAAKTREPLAQLAGVRH